MGTHPIRSSNHLAPRIRPASPLGLRVRAAPSTQHAGKQTTLAALDPLRALRHHRLHIRMAGVQCTEWIYGGADGAEFV